MKLIILVLAIFASSQASDVWDTLNATIVVVEFQRDLDEPDKNYEQYKDILDTLTKDETKLDMVIFPEGSLGIAPKIAVEVNPEDIPCGLENYTQPLKNVSCLAKQFNTYLVTNIAEKIKCENPDTTTSQNCKDSNVYIYNTNLVFDRTGKIVTRYRKYNLFGEPDKDRPEKPQVEILETDFGPKFGIFTCFDILFKSPAQDVLKKDVDGIIYPTNWHSELPFLTALQSQQMWAYAHETVIFAAGGNERNKSSGGSGVFKGSKGTILTDLVAAGGSKALIYKSVNGKVDPQDSKSDDELGKEMDAFPLWEDDNLTNFTFEPLVTSETEISKQVCYEKDDDKFCCNFNVTLSSQPTKEGEKFYSYLFVAYKGTRTKKNIGTSGNEICGIIACLEPKITTCGQRFSNYSEVTWPLTFNEITITADFDLSENKTQFPNSLKSSIRPIDASETEWTSTKDDKIVKNTFKTKKEQNRLLTFAIYGRDFGLDALPEVNAANPVGISLMVFIAMIAAVMIR